MNYDHPNPRTNAMNSKYGRLTILHRKDIFASGVNRVAYACRCDCGQITHTRAFSLTSGKAKSCGCLQREKQKQQKWRLSHGASVGGKRTRLYTIWQGIIKRCENPKEKPYKWYGGRGIKVCKSWHDFAVFQKWAMAHGYSPELQIDRKNNDGDYRPVNCRWVTSLANANNRRGNCRYEFPDGTFTISQAARRYGTTKFWMRWRLHVKKLSPAQILEALK